MFLYTKIGAHAFIKSAKNMGYEQIITAAAPAVNSALGMIGQRGRQIRYNKQSEKLMGLQVQNQMKLNQQGSDLQYDMWKKTNYPAQVAMLKEAGLNPALMYGQAGSGGITGSQGGGSASSGNAAPIQPWIPMDMGNAMKTIAEMKLIQAQTDKTKAETENVTEQTIGKKIENNWSSETLGARIFQTVVDEEITEKQFELIQQQSKFYVQQAKAEIDKIGADAEISKKEAALKDIELDWMQAMKAVKIGSTAIDSILGIFKLWVMKQR